MIYRPPLTAPRCVTWCQSPLPGSGGGCRVSVRHVSPRCHTGRSTPSTPFPRSRTPFQSTAFRTSTSTSRTPPPTTLRSSSAGSPALSVTWPTRLTTWRRRCGKRTRHGEAEPAHPGRPADVLSTRAEVSPHCRERPIPLIVAGHRAGWSLPRHLSSPQVRWPQGRCGPCGGRRPGRLPFGRPGRWPSALLTPASHLASGQYRPLRGRTCLWQVMRSEIPYIIKARARRGRAPPLWRGLPASCLRPGWPRPAARCVHAGKGGMSSASQRRGLRRGIGRHRVGGGAVPGLGHIVVSSHPVHRRPRQSRAGVWVDGGRDGSWGRYGWREAGDY